MQSAGFIVYISKERPWCKHLLKLLTVLDTLRPDLNIQDSWYFSEQYPVEICSIPSIVVVATNKIMNPDETLDFVLSLMMGGSVPCQQQPPSQHTLSQQPLSQQSFQQRPKAKPSVSAEMSYQAPEPQRTQRTSTKNTVPGPDMPAEFLDRNVSVDIFSHCVKKD